MTNDTDVVSTIRHHQIEDFLVNDETKLDVFDFLSIREIAIVVDYHDESL